MKARPPRWAEALLSGALPRSPRGDGIRGDLREEFAVRARTTGVLRARAWFAGQAISIIAWSALDRWRGRGWGDQSGRRWLALADLLRHIRTASRSLWRSPGYSMTVIATLGLALTVTIAVFAVVRGVLLQPLPLTDPDRLVRLDRLRDDGSYSNGGVAYPDLLDWRTRIGAFTDLAGNSGAEAIYTVDGIAEVWKGLSVTPNFLQVLGIQPHLGLSVTGFAPGTEAGAERILLSFRIWEHRFGADPSIVGKAVQLDGTDWIVDGVLPAIFAYPAADVDFLIPLQNLSFLTNRSAGFLRVFARLADDVSLDQARTEVDRVVAAIDAEHGEWEHGVGVRRVHDVLVEPVRRTLLIFQGSVALILLIGCANVAALTLARTERRRAEFALRTSLGATPGRLMQALLTESLLLSLAGGLLGLGAAVLGVPFILTLLPDDLPRAEAVAIDPWVAAFATVAAITAGLIAGLVPAARAAGVATRDGLRAGPTVVGRGRRTQEVLAGAQVTIAVVLLFAAGLLLRSFVALSAVDPGFDSDRTLVVEVGLDPARYGGREQILTFHRTLLTSVAGLDGVASVALSSHLPFSPSGLSASIVREGEVHRRGGEQVNIEFVNGDYFGTMGIPLRRGRGFDLGPAPSERQVVINETAAARLWPGANPIGRKISFDVEENETAAAGSLFEVIGVVGDSLKRSLDEERLPIAYYALPDVSRFYTFISGRFFYLTVQTDGRDPRGLAEPVQVVLGAADPTVPPRMVATLADLVSITTRPARLVASVLGFFAVLGVGVALLGVYGVMAYGVSQSLREMGLRMALGATRASVRGRVLLRAAKIVLVAGMVGSAGALGAGSFLGSKLYQVRATDPATLAAVLAATLAGGLAAAYLPAVVASRVDPMRMLRNP